MTATAPHALGCFQRHHQRQRGIALVLGLVFLLLMTLLGVSAMSNNALQEQMAGMFQERVRMLHAAEYGAARALEDTVLLSMAASGSTARATFSLAIDEIPGAQADIATQVHYLGARLGRANPDTTEHHFRITSEAVSPATGARSRIHQGVSITGPAAPDVLSVTDE